LQVVLAGQLVKSVNAPAPVVAKHCGSSTPLFKIANPLKIEPVQLPEAVKLVE
jgi:hypothetical protein